MKKDVMEILPVALRVAEKISDPESKSCALKKIVDLYLDQMELSRATEIAVTIEDDVWRGRASALGSILKAYGSIGQHFSPLEVIDELGVEQWRDDALAAIASGQVDAGELNSAMDTLDLIHDQEVKEDAREDVLEKLVSYHLSSRDFSQAIEIAQTIEDTKRKSDVLRDIALDYVEQKRIFEAIKITEDIVDPEALANALIEIISLCIESDKTDQVEVLLSRASEAVDRIPYENPRARFYAEIALQYFRFGNIAISDTLLSKSLEIVDLIPCRTDRDWRSFSIAINCAELGKYKDAVGLIEDKMEYESDEARMLSDIAEKVADRGDFSVANEIISSIKDMTQKAGAFTTVAARQFKQGKREDAEETLLQAGETIEGMSNLEEISRALSRIAYVYSEAGHFSRAIEITNKIEQEEVKISTLNGIADEYFEKGHSQEAEDTLQLAVTAAEAEGDLHKRAQELITIGRHYVEIGQREKAEALFARVADLARNIEDYYQKSEILFDLWFKKSDGEVFTQFLDAVRMIEDKVKKGEMLIKVADWFVIPNLFEKSDGKVFTQFLDAIRMIGDKAKRVEVLTEIADLFNEESFFYDEERNLTREDIDILRSMD